jgi:xylan 1,4-beta-xylosidase
LLNQVRYDQAGKPTADYPINALKPAPKLPSSGIPWMVPHSDFFASEKLNPEWSFLGYTPASSYSLTARPGWLSLSDKRKINTVIKTDAEHNYALMTRVDFDAKIPADQAGIWVFNGLQTLSVKLCSTADSSGNKAVTFSYNGMTSAAADTAGTILWLKLVRENHMMTGYWSADGSVWIQVGGKFDVTGMDNQQANYNGWCGNRQGLFVQNSTAYFDCYLYRDAYTPIMAECPANQSGTTRLVTGQGTAVLDDIQTNDWALYAGVEFGTAEYSRMPDSVKIVASPAADGGIVEVWLDSLDTGHKIAQCSITGASGYATFTAPVKPVSGRHDVYLKFVGTSANTLFQLQSLCFTGKPVGATSVAKPSDSPMPQSYHLEQNYPNPFNPTTRISFNLPSKSYVSLKVFDVMGREVSTLVSEEVSAGTHNCAWNGSAYPSGTYFYRLHAGSYMETKRLTLLK